jgi:DNA invertase Pin-like site-specific DNA recombinase
MKYAIMKYLRISAEDIDLDGFDKYESNSIVNQRAYLDDFISKMPEFADCEILEELDDGRTGTNFSRPGVQRAIGMARTGKAQCIVVKDLSRWGRNYLEVGDFLEQKFPAWGVRFISVNDMYDSAALNGTAGGIDIAFRNLIYELYSQDLSEKTRSAKMSAARSGKNSNAEAFYGYKKDPNDIRKLIVDEPAAEVVRRIFALAADNRTATQIAKILNADKVPTPQERKMELGSRHRWTSGEASFWYSTVLSRILGDERYTGKLIYGRKRTPEIGQKKQIPVPESEWVVVDGAIPAIITQEQHDAARKLARGRRAANHKPAPRGLLFRRELKCGRCGKGLKAICCARDVKYSCATPQVTDKYGCKIFRMLEKDIAEAVFDAFRQQIAFADGARQALEAKTAKLKPGIEKKRAEAARLASEAAKSKTAKMALWEKYHGGGITAEGFQRENERIDGLAAAGRAKIDGLNREILALEAETGRENVFVERFCKQGGITELTRAVVEEFISEIKVYSPERIEIVFNYADERAKLLPAVNNVNNGHNGTNGGREKNL